MKPKYKSGDKVKVNETLEEGVIQSVLFLKDDEDAGVDYQIRINNCFKLFHQEELSLVNNTSNQIPSLEPLHLLHKLLREKHKLIVEVDYNVNSNHKWVYQIHSDKEFCVVDCEIEYNTYEEALTEGCKEALKLIK